MKDCISRLNASLTFLAEESGDSYKKRPSYKTFTYFPIKAVEKSKIASPLSVYDCFVSFVPKAHRFVAWSHYWRIYGLREVTYRPKFYTLFIIIPSPLR